MGIWNMLKSKVNRQDDVVAARATEAPPGFDFKAAYERIVGQLETMNKLMQAQHEAIKLAAEMADTLVQEAGKLDCEVVGSEHDGKRLHGYVISEDCYEAYELVANTLKNVYVQVHEQMKGVARGEIEFRLTSKKTTASERKFLQQIMQHMDREDALLAKARAEAEAKLAAQHESQANV